MYRSRFFRGESPSLTMDGRARGTAGGHFTPSDALVVGGRGRVPTLWEPRLAPMDGSKPHSGINTRAFFFARDFQRPTGSREKTKEVSDCCDRRVALSMKMLPPPGIHKTLSRSQQFETTRTDLPRRLPTSLRSTLRAFRVVCGCWLLLAAKRMDRAPFSMTSGVLAANSEPWRDK